MRITALERLNPSSLSMALQTFVPLSEQERGRRFVTIGVGVKPQRLGVGQEKTGVTVDPLIVGTNLMSIEWTGAQGVLSFRRPAGKLDYRYPDLVAYFLYEIVHPAYDRTEPLTFPLIKARASASE